MRRAWLTAICSVALSLGASVPAHAAFDDPLFFDTPQAVPPAGFLDGPCGLAVRSSGRLYVSDYYHRAIDEFSISGKPQYESQPLAASGPINPHTGPLDDPCGLAVDAAGTLYVNDYHREVVRFGAPLSLAGAQVIDSGDPADPYSNPTGVAVDPASSLVYVDDRTYVAVYDSQGAPVLNGSAPLRIGEGTLEDGYGIAVSGYSPKAGYLYVPDAATNTVKVFDPATSITTPVQTIAGPPGGFGSLRDSAIAVDNTTGEIYVTDSLGPQLTEEPWATVYVFTAAGAFEGRLKHSTVDAAPTGLAVDNSGGSAQGRVYVTSGIGEEASLYGYPAGAATVIPEPPLKAGSVGAGGNSGSTGSDSSASTGAPPGSGALTREGTAQAGSASAVDGQIGRATLSACPYGRIQPGTSSHALTACRSSLVGRGSFSADITQSGQEPYPTKGKLLVFNGVRKGKPVLFGHVYSPRPFASSFVIVFKLKKLHKGILLVATLPAAMKAWGRLTGLTMIFSRRYSYKGKSHSYLSSDCPSPKGFSKTAFPLARASFDFKGGKGLSSVLTGACRAPG